MKTIQNTSLKEGRLLGFVRLLSFLSHPLWTPKPDEKRFLVGLPATLILILILWKQGLGDALGGYSIPAIFALWCAAYVCRFRQRLKDRGELKRFIIFQAAYVALLLGIIFYARW